MVSFMSRLFSGVALLAVAGCLGETAGPPVAVSAAQRRVEPISLRPEDLPSATKAALAAALFAVRGLPESEHPGVRFAPEIAQKIQASFDYTGFSAASMTLFEHERARDGLPGIDLKAAIGFVDLLDRRAVLGLMLTFGRERGEILIRQAAAVPIFARIPRFALFLVPRHRLPAGWPETHAELWWLAARESVGPAERPRWLDGSHDLVLVAVGKDRFDPKTPLQLALVEGTSTPIALESQRLDFAGFPVVAAAARLRVDAPGRVFALIARPLPAPGLFGRARSETLARFDLLDPRPATVRLVPDVAPPRRARV